MDAENESIKQEDLNGDKILCIPHLQGMKTQTGEVESAGSRGGESNGHADRPRGETGH